MSKKLVILNPDHAMEVPFEQQLTVGRDVYNSLSLSDADLSRSHAIIFEHDDHATVKDLNSRNGVYVNGDKVKEKDLRDGDEVILGSTVLIFNPPEKSGPAKPVSQRAEYLLKKAAARAKPEDAEELFVYSIPQMEKVIHRLLNQPEGANYFSLTHATAMLRTIHEMSRAKGTNELFRVTLRRALAMLGGDRGVIMEADAPKKKLKVRSIISHDEAAAKIEIPNEVLKIALQDESCAYCPNVLDDVRFENIVSRDRQPVHSFIVSPIIGCRNYLGFIYLDSENREREYDYIAMRELYFIASMLGGMLQPQTLHFAHEPVIRSEIAETM